MANPFLSRQERFAVVGSTSDVIREWLAAGTAEVCLAVADEQSAGRGRQGRAWWAPAGRALLLSLGFRPAWLQPDRAWRLGAVVGLAMADAAEEVAGLADGAIRLKWPNDLVVDGDAGRSWDAGTGSRIAAPTVPAGPAASVVEGGVRKLAGVLGESSGLGTGDPIVIVGIGINVDWPATDFPPDLAPGMSSLHEAAGGRPVERALLLDAFVSRLEARVEALRAGRFDLADWRARQLVAGQIVRLERPDGSDELVRAIGVDPASGGLLVEEPEAPAGERLVLSGEIRHLRLAAPEGVTT
jgi:BirA family biotin operon repressor/biotin-[acetyl-CoA-carboxylase] ligase